MPAPVGPVSRNSPASLSSSKSTLSVPANGPNAVTVRWCSRISRRPRPAADRLEVGVAVVVDAAGVAGAAGAAAPPRWWPRGRAPRRRSRARRRGRCGRRRGARPARATPARALGLEAEHQRVREPRRAAGPSRAAAGAASVSVTCEPGVLGTSACRGSASRSSMRPRSVASRRGTGAGDELGALEAVGAEVDQPGALGVAGLGERVGQRRAAVADRVGERLPAVQVAERGVVDAGEQAGRRDLRCRRRRCRARCRTPSAARPRGCRPRTRAPAPPSGCRAGAARSASDPAHRRGRAPPRGCGSAGPRRCGPRRARGRGCRRPRPGRARPRAAPGVPTSCQRVRRCTPAASASRALKPEPGGRSRGCRW